MDIIAISLENEMDLVLAHKRSMRVAEKLGLTIATQTTFATAVSEISRSIIEHTDSGMLRIGIDHQKQRFSLRALISFSGQVRFTKEDEGFYYAQKLVPQFLLSESEDLNYVEMKIGLPRSLNLDPLQIKILKEFFLHDQPLNAYEELKQKNLSMKGMAEVLEQEIRLSKLIDEQKTEFISVASHEIKTPITVLKAYSQMARAVAGNKDSKLAGILDKIDFQTGKLVQLVQRLLDVSKLESSQLDYTREDVQLNAFILDMAAIMQNIQPGHTILLELCEDCPLEFDKLRMEQVFTNLIGNAAKYSEKGTRITISTKKVKEGFINISIADEGIGMSEHTRASVFEKFYRDETIAKTHQGLGIGLYISSKILRENGGEIWLESEEGKGSVFHFTLPLPA